MSRKRIVISVLVLLAMVVGGSTTPARAHCGGKHTGDHPHCVPGGPGAGDAIKYDVIMEPGDLWLKAAETFEGTEGGGSSRPIHVFFQPLNLDLNFFFHRFGELNGEDRATKCFSGTPLEDSFRSLSITRETDRTALVRYWFRAFADDGESVVKYQLSIGGDFLDPDDWRPAGTNHVDLLWWWMRTENKKNKNISCRAAGEFTGQPGGEDGPGQRIVISRRP